jgi:cytosine/adenosine deaminase-related metal-dependent hydrolase
MSNIVLYNQTANVPEALAQSIPVALAPDWTISGSNNVLEELKVAYAYSEKSWRGAITPRRFFKMVTADAAKVAGLEERMGRLAYGYAADFFLAPKLDPDPFKSLLKTYPRHIHLVFVDGAPLYGDPQELRKWLPPDSLDTIEVDKAKKAILMRGDPRGAWHSRQRYEDVVSVLRNVLPAGPAPLIEE